MKKKLLSTLVAVGLLASLAACGTNNQNQPEKSNQPGQSDGKVYELSFSMHIAAESTYGLTFQKMFDEIYEKTDGHVKITIFGSSTLASASDVADMVKDGGCDMGLVFTNFYYGQYPLSDVIAIPLQGAQTCTQGTQVLWDIYENYEEMAAEWSDFKTFQIFANPVNHFYSTTPIASVADLNGYSLRSTTGGIADCLKAWGANVITMAPNDIYDSIAKNNIQGYTFEPTGIIDYSLTEVTPYKIEMGLFHAPFVVVMNKDVYNSLPDEYKAALDEFATREASVAFAQITDQYVEECQQTFEDGGGQVLSISDSAYAEFKEAADAYAEDWIADRSKNGFDARSYYNFCSEAYQKYADEG